ncbi:hypothetical protein R1sor_004299 [Riccia sorocarpa]|uniref:Uncharacterized protein n=1 Tax=Riccia sorocarpa TaxID=122646 RepID=A0ABD3HGB4_9MARC
MIINPLQQTELTGSHFHVYLFEARKEIVLIKWTSRAHLDKTGKPCHGLHDSSALAGKAVVAPRLSKRCRDYVERMLRTGVEPREILNFHVKEMRRNYGEVTDEKTIWHRDLQLTTKDVDNIRARLRKLMHNYHPDDAIATKMWVEQNSEKVIYYQGGNQENGVPFMLVVATDWMLKNLASLGHGNALVRAMWESIGSDSVIAAHAAVMLTDVSEKVKMLLARRSSLDDVTIEPFTSLPGTDNSLKRKPDFLERHFQRTEGRKRQTEVSSQALTQLEVSVPQFIRKVQPRESMQQQLDGRALLSMDLNAIPIEYTTDVLPAKRRK